MSFRISNLTNSSGNIINGSLVFACITDKNSESVGKSATITRSYLLPISTIINMCYCGCFAFGSSQTVVSAYSSFDATTNKVNVTYHNRMSGTSTTFGGGQVLAIYTV